MKILNLTQHIATPEQIDDGVFEPSAEDKKEIQRLLTFHQIPSVVFMHSVAKELAQIATKYIQPHDPETEYGLWVMIGGAPYFMRTIENALYDENMKPVYSFSKRESVDQVQSDGSVRKVAVFKHCGFVEV